jgi:hypothetical protein
MEHYVEIHMFEQFFTKNLLSHSNEQSKIGGLEMQHV